MARPAPDVDKIRARMLDLAEEQLAASGGQRLVLSDIAARMGMSQSNAHRFFRTKSDLVRALAERWFETVEARVSQAVADADTPQDALRACILQTLQVKRARHDADPVLFRAYLVLAADHRDLVQTHTARLTAILRGVLARLVPADRLDGAVALVEDATVQFRLPTMIAQARAHATEARAEAVIDALLPALLGVGNGEEMG